jgi:23S rRNA pseudouridine2605 synthase
MQIRLQKLLSASSICSRRVAEQMIKDEKIRINGNLATLGVKAKLNDKININNSRYVCVTKDITTQILLYHKPVGVICSRNDPLKRPTIYQQLPISLKNFLNIGRLDINSAGLLLFTNNGELCYRLSHPSYKIRREYIIRTLGELNEEQVKKIRNGIEFEGQLYKILSIKLIGGEGVNKTYKMVLQEGKNHEIRNVFSFFNIQVNKILRIKFANIVLPRTLRPTKHMLLEHTECENILKSVGMLKNQEILKLQFIKKIKK